jgi:protein-disulfide isomerase
MFHANRYRDTLSSPGIRPIAGAGAAVEVIQFGDFECKECGCVASSLQSFRHRNADLISFNYKHFPTSVHRNAWPAAEAAECARAQGKFWSMHNLLITNQTRLDIRSLYEYAESLGLDMARFTSEMDEETYMPTIRADIYSGTLAGVRRTPAYFVDGLLVEPAGGLSVLFETIRRAAARRGHSASPRSDLMTGAIFRIDSGAVSRLDD